MASDEVVSSLRDRREPGGPIVTPGQPFSRTLVSQRAIDCFRAKKSLAIWFNESDSALELFEGNFWKSIRRFLIGDIINFVRSNFAPALDPAPAKMTFAVPNHERLRWRIGDTQIRLRFHCILL